MPARYSTAASRGGSSNIKTAYSTEVVADGPLDWIEPMPVEQWLRALFIRTGSEVRAMSEV